MVVTSTEVTNQRKPILYVTHELDEEGGFLWQFHSGSGDYSVKKIQLVRLDTIFLIDQKIDEIADLPVGFSAQREAPNEPWIYKKLK